jgi:hypothetical protein
MIKIMAKVLLNCYSKGGNGLLILRFYPLKEIKQDISNCLLVYCVFGSKTSRTVFSAQFFWKEINKKSEKLL